MKWMLNVRSPRLATVALVALFATACGGGSPAGESGPENDTAQSGPEQELVTAATSDGSLTWYSVLPDASVEATVAAFESRYPGMKVNALRLSSGPMATRYSQERTAGANPADVLTISSPEFFTDAYEKGWFETTLEDLPALEDWPEQYYEEGRATTGLLPLLIGYNTDQVAAEEVPEGWEDLLDPKWKGKMFLGDPRTVPAYLALAELWRQEYAEDYLKKFAQQDYTIVSSIVPGSQELAAGGGALVVPNSHTVLAPLIEQGAPVAASEFPTPTTGVEYVSAIATEAGKPDAARLFMNFLLSEEGQAVFNRGGGTSVLGKVADDLRELPDDYRPLEPLLESAKPRTAELLRLLGVE
jgi:iron(III) transport system substrate-binding protein